MSWQAPSPSLGTASDNVGVSFVTCTVPLTQARFAVGMTLIRCTGYDLTLNAASCAFAITIQDKQPPYIVCPPNLNGTIAVNDVSTSLYLNFGTLQDPIDNVDSVSSGTISVSFRVNGNLANIGSNWGEVPIGRTFFKYTAVDSSGNSASCQFNGAVIKEGATLDTSPPTIINCPLQPTYYYSTDSRAATAVVSWPLISAIDNVGVVSSNYITNPSGYSRGVSFPVGLTTIQYFASDAAGNVAYCDFAVEVMDNEAPRVSCPYSFTKNCDPPFRSANVSWQVPTFSDNVGLLTTYVSLEPGLFIAGTYQVVARAVDVSGNTANCSFSFT